MSGIVLDGSVPNEYCTVQYCNRGGIMSQTEKVRSRDGTSIAFERTGEGPALIMVDAALGFRGFGSMGPLAARLGTDFTVFTYDRRGRGESTDTPPYAVDHDIKEMADHNDVNGGKPYDHYFTSLE
jgi:hypothetical protein